MTIRRTALVALSLLMSAGCVEAVAVQTTPGSAQARSQAPLWLEVAFDASIDALTGEVVISTTTPSLMRDHEGELRVVEAASYCPLRVAAGSSSSVALTSVAADVGRTPAACGLSGFPYDTAGALCVPATLTSGFEGALLDVYAEVTQITPEAGYGAYLFPYGTGADPLQVPEELGAPDGAAGLWSFGDIAPGASASSTWTFENAGGAFSIRGRILGRVAESPNGLDDDCDGRVDEGLGLYDLGEACVLDEDCASATCREGVCAAAPCDVGQAPDGGGGCVEIDECAVDNGGCGHPDVVRCTDQPRAEAPLCACDADDVRSALLDGVGALDVGGSLGSRLLPMTRDAFAVVTDASGDVLAAGLYIGEGRIFAIGHEGMMNAVSGGGSGLDQLMRNATTWLGGEGATVGIEAPFDNLRANLRGAGFDVISATPSALSDVDVFVGDLWNDYTATEMNDLRAFVERGGALLLGGHSWYWAYDNPDPYANYSGNQLLRGFGLLVSPNVVDMGVYTLEAGDHHHAICGLDALASDTTPDDERAQAAAVAGEAVSFVPWGDPYLSAAERAVETVGDVVPTWEEPLREEDALERLAGLIQMRRALNAPALDVRAHASAADFPGAVPADAPRVRQRVTVDGSFAGRDRRWSFAGPLQPAWRSTGLYAPPGEVITVTLPERALAAGLDLQIGAHTDTLYEKEAWERLPEIVRRVPLVEPTTEAASGFGGLLYVRVPAGSELGRLEVTIEGAVEAPHFVVGRDSDASWIAGQRDLQAPFAELELDSLVLTVPSSAIRGLDNPEALMALWDEAMDAIAELATVNPERERHERFVLDRQISLGLYHSGYPIMGHTYSTADLVDLDAILAGGSWGPFHEIGHNHQYDDWILPGTVETTCNLYSVYVMEEVISRSRDLAHPAISPESRAERIASYLAAPDFGAWSVWTALETYLQLQEAFGWSLYTTLFEEYRGLSESERAVNDDERIQQWIVRSSIAAGLDLTPFYAAWDFPITRETASTLSRLPAWTRHPMQ